MYEVSYADKNMSKWSSWVTWEGKGGKFAGREEVREEMAGEIDGTLLNLRARGNFLETSGMPSKSNNQYM